MRFRRHRQSADEQPVDVKQHENPYEGLDDLNELYDALVNGRPGVETPRWPNETIQKGYTGTNRIDLLRRSLEFGRMLDEDGAFVPGWRGLDYGCGWGRFGTLLLTKGGPEQLDLCDAWQPTLDILADLGHRNRIFKVSELLKPGEIPGSEYDMILSFSVFTHLSPRAFETNIPALVAALKPGGRFYLTVRHEEFIDHKYPDSSAEFHEVLDRDGVFFVDSGGNMGTEKVFGDMVITPGYLEQCVGEAGTVRYLGLPHTLQHVYVVERR